MAGLEGKVAFVTGAARGMGRNHAVRLAERGVDLIALDVNRSIGSVPYPGSTPEDLAETVALVEGLGRRIVAREADVRDVAAVRAIVDEGVAELGRLDIVIPNAGIASVAAAGDMTPEAWDDMIGINLTGAWNAFSAALPHVRAAGRGGSVVFIGSTAAHRPVPNLTHYVAAKHGVIGMTKTLALELGPENIRVNAVSPTNVDTPMVQNEFIMKLFMPDLEHPSRADAELPDSPYRQANVIPIPWIDADDVTNVLLFLVSDEARYITGIAIPVDAGFLIK
jgi:SDR family mycofactocin-dependent oxidoreductase